MSHSFPDEGVVDCAAAVVHKILRGNLHIWSHSLRYLTDRDQKKIARRIARAALYSAWAFPELKDRNPLALRLAAIAEELSDQGSVPSINIRWCAMCETLRPAIYARNAYRCPICHSASQPI